LKGLALDYVIKLIILLAVALVVISLVIYFANNVKSFLKSKQQPKVKPQIINASSFITSQVKAYMEACWSKGEEIKEDTLCYILKGDLTQIDKDNLKKVDFRTSVDFDETKRILIIRYERLGRKVVVEN
jgi:hypothetical protein